MGMEQGGYIEDQGSYDAGGGADFIYGYGGGGDEYSYSPGVDVAPIDQSGGTDLFGAYTDYFLESGFDLTTAMELAAQEASAPTFQLEGEGLLPLPDVSFPFYELPYIPDAFLTPYTPIFPEGPAPLPPVITPLMPLDVQPPPQTPLPTTPTTGAKPIAPGLPPACPTGQYHPFPIGHPDQNKCVPFPPAQTGSKPQQQQKPAASSGGASSGGAQQKPQQQACPTGYCKHPTTGQCIPIPQGYTRHPQTQVCTPAQQQQQCPTGYYPDPMTRQCKPIPPCTTPGTVFDQATGRCVPAGQAISPLPMPGEAEDLLSSLKEIPWWLWLALGGLILLSRDGDGGKKTTVTYRRAK